jgi:hypothetical protein
MQFQVLGTQRKRYYKIIDKWAKQNAVKLINGEKVSIDILKQIRSIYFGAKTESKIDEAHKSSTIFSVAYHTPVTGDLEFLIARTLFHYSDIQDFDWEVHLRRQIKKNNKMVVPDIRIETKGNILGIIEIKTRVGWMQSFFSAEQYKAGVARNMSNSSLMHPDEAIKNAQQQLDKYIEAFEIDTSRLFMLVPSLKQAHRKKFTEVKYGDYKRQFKVHSGLDASNLVVLTEDLNYDAGDLVGRPLPGTDTDEFEKMVDIIAHN